MARQTATRSLPMSFAIKPEVKSRLDEFRADGGDINVSAICNAAILAAIGNAREVQMTRRIAELPAFIRYTGTTVVDANASTPRIPVGSTDFESHLTSDGRRA